MNVLLYGATGLLGHNVLISLLQQGYTVVAPVRNPDGLHLPPELANHPNLHLAGFHSAILQPSEAGSNDYDFPVTPSAIINCAATTDMSLLHYDDYLPMNKIFVEWLLRLMDHLDINTLVQVSTANTIGFGTKNHPGTEDNDICPPFSNSYYARSKREGETMLEWAARQRPDRHIVILNPGFMVGPYDTHPSSGKLLLAAYRRRLMASPKGGKSFVHVRDVATAAVNALTMGRNGHRYLLTGEDMSLKDFYALQARECNYSQRLVELPDRLVGAAGRVGDLLRWMGLKTQLSTRNVRQLMVMEYYSCEKARDELLFPQTPIATAIDEFFEWYLSQR